MEPASVITLLIKLISIGLAGGSAWSRADIHEKEWTVFKEVLDFGGTASSLRSPEAQGAPEQAYALLTLVFGRAMSARLVVASQMKSGLPRLTRWAAADERAQRKEVEERIRYALAERATTPDLPVSALPAAMQSPLSLPLYQRLWDAFTNPNLDSDGPFLDLNGTERRAMERDVLLYWEMALSEPRFASVKAWIQANGGQRKNILQRLLLTDLASWGERHVFGNLRPEQWANTPQIVPFLALDVSYVEPEVKCGEEPSKAAIAAILDRCTKSPVVAVSADFGHGKSLTARWLARNLAQTWLEGRGVSLESWLPIFVRCASDFIGEGFELEPVVRKAWKRQAEEIGLDLSTNDPGFELPLADQRTLYILDGLDEVALGHRRLNELFDKLWQASSARHRFLILTRPGALPDREVKRPPDVLELQPFRTDGPAPQVQRWLDSWNQLARPGKDPITLETIGVRGLTELAATPILLLMIATTWQDAPSDPGAASKANLYEAFFQHIARGKHEADKDGHPEVALASERLRGQLASLRILPKNAPPTDAMLWLLSRVAWAAHCLEHEGKQLDRHEVDDLLRRELMMSPREENFEPIRMGLLLTLQADLRGGDHPILFGHKSFREFLVGRYWDLQLQRIVSAPLADREALEKPLLAAPLISPLEEDQSFVFLMARLNRSEPIAGGKSADGGVRRRRKLKEWAEETFTDERLESNVHEVYRDRRPRLRNAALAIACSLVDVPPLKLRDARPLRSLLAWEWVTGENQVRILCGLILPKGSHLGSALLASANLAGATLARVHLSGALLVASNLSRANLVEAFLHGGQLDGSSLHEANLRMAVLPWASLVGADLDGANLTRADLSHAVMRDCSLVGAIVDHANLCGTNLAAARIVNTTFTQAVYNSATVWPDGFDPVGAGAVLIKQSRSPSEPDQSPAVSPTTNEPGPSRP